MQTYSSKALARRGAFRQRLNHNEFSIEQDANGRWIIVTNEPSPSPVEPELQVNSMPQAPVAPKAKAISRKATKAKSKRQRSSTAVSPVAFIWHWLAQNDHSSMKRADAIAALVALGVHPGTASTQRSKFMNASPTERQARVARYAEGL